MVDRIAEEGAIQYAQQSTADVGTVSRLAGAGQIEADMIRLVVDGFYTQKVSGLSVRGRIINKMIDAGFLPKKRYNFTDESKTLDSSITFSRTSNATVTDSDGLIKYAPHNLLANSEAFETATYSKVNATVTSNAAVSPNGTTTADKFIADNTLNQHRLRVTGVATTADNIASIYAKAAEYDWIILQGGGSGYAYFDVKNGVVGTQVNTVGTIESVGNGWYRCSVALTGSTTILDIWVTTTNGTTSFTGDNTSGVYIWGAQLINLPCVSNDYISTSPANLLGFTEEFENAAWTKSNSFVQTNLFTYSEQFDNAAWTKAAILAFGSGSTANAVVAPNGTMTADTIVPNTSSGNHYVQSNTATITAGQTFTVSVYARAAGYTFLRVTGYTVAISAGFRVDVNLSTGTGTTSTFGAGASVSGYTVTPLNDGWYRITVTGVADASSTSVLSWLQIADNSSFTAYSGNGTSGITLWGAQLVQGATAGDYMQTGASTMATRYLDPFGSVYAKKLVENTANALHYQQQIISCTSGTPITLSVYAKAAERTKIELLEPYALIARVFNLSNGTVESNQTGVTNATIFGIQDVGNGWYRCYIGLTTSGTSTALRVSVSNGSATSYTGDGTSGIYISGAQVSNSASLDPYVYNPTTALTSAARYGARFNYNPVTKVAEGLLIEEARTNLLTYSEQFDNAAWTKPRASISANTAVSPDGMLDADKLIEDTTASNTHLVRQVPTVSANTTYTYSVYLKAAERTTAFLQSSDNASDTNGFFVTVNLSNGTLSNGNKKGTGTYTGSTITPVGNGWYRVTLTGIVDASSTSVRYEVFLSNGSSTTYTGDGTSGLFLWGAQVEAGAFATSYIPTVASTVTRSADIASVLGRNFSSWYNQNEGTLYGELAVSSSSYSIGVSLDIGSGGAFGTTAYMNWAGSSWQLNPNTSPLNLLSLVSTTNPAKVVAGLATNNSVLSANGLIGTVDSSCLTPIAATTLTIGKGGWSGGTNYINGTIKSIRYWPTRLTDAQLVAITS
jgi:hypothetical protein